MDRRRGSITSPHVTLQGQWKIQEEYASPQKGSILKLSFEAKDVFIVMGSLTNNSRVKISVDGKPENLGNDVKSGVLTVTANKLYSVVHLPIAGNHTVTFEFLDGNAQVYSFTN